MALDSSGQVTSTARFSRYTIDTTVLQHLKTAKASAKYELPMIADAFWVLFDETDFKELTGQQPMQYLDTTLTFEEVVCDCMIKNDTVYLQGGIGYQGSIGFDLKVTGDLFSARIGLSGLEYRTTASSKPVSEILLDSKSQFLKIAGRDSLQAGKRLIGELIIETRDFFIKSEPGRQKIYMKVLFGCELDDMIVL